MHFFCILCIPLVFFLRQANLGEGNGLKGPGLKGRGLWALLLGSLAALVMYITGPLIMPGAFGFSRWMSGFVDIAGLPALIPFVACLLLVLLKVFPVTIDYAGLALLWLMPVALIRAISGTSSPGGSSQFPISLVLVPVLWAVQALGMAFFIGCIMRNPRRNVVIYSVLGIIALPIAATTSWWAFFRQQSFLGGVLLVVSFIPAAAYFIKMRNNEEREEMRDDEQITDNSEQITINSKQ